MSVAEKKPSPVDEDVEIARRLSLLFPPPERRWLPRERPIQWAVGIVAAKRKNGASYIHQTIASCARAGFPRPWIFAEPGLPGLSIRDGVPRLNGYDGPVTINGERCGVFPNHYLALVAMRHSQATQGANGFLLLEDDVLLARGLATYLDQYVAWPCAENQLAALCLFTHQYFANWGPGWHRYTKEVWYSLWGAQALAFSKRSLDDYLESPLHRLHVERPIARESRFADSELTRWADALDRQIWFACGLQGQSLVRHMGDMSSVFDHGEGSIRRRSEASFADSATMKLDWRDPPRPRETLIVSTEPIRNGVEAAAERKARRLPICDQCPHWVEPDESAQRGVPPGCDLCATPGKKPTLETLGDLSVVCKRGLW